MSSLPSTCRSIGAELAAAREARGLSEEAMAASLMLSKRQLVSLEHAELTGFYGLSYYRMALRKYMEAVGLPTDRLQRIDWSGADPMPTTPASDHSGPSVSFDDDATRSRAPAAVAVVLVALSAAGYLFWSSRPEWMPLQPPTISVSELPAAPAVDPQGLSPTAPVTSAAPPPSSEWPGMAPAGSTAPAADTDLAPPPAESVPVSARDADTSLDGIRVEVASTTWVFARFEDNSTLERGIAGGTSLELDRYPVYLAVGTADGVSLVVDGRRVPLTPFARNGQIRLSRQELAPLRP
jgi:cytoskeleton protein RodZ